MFNEVVQLVESGTILVGGITFVIYSIKVGKAIGRLEQLIEIHSKDIDELKNNKVDKEVCEAYRDND